MTAVRRYGPGDVNMETRPGDLVLTHRDSWPSRLIVFGQRLRFRGPDRRFCRWSHVACVVGHHGELVEALGKGVQRSSISRYADVSYHYVSIDAEQHDRRQMASFAEACVGRDYGYLEILSLGLTLLTGAKFAFGNPGTLICSALAAQMLCRGEYVFDRDPGRMMPADIAEFLDVTPGG